MDLPFSNSFGNPLTKYLLELRRNKPALPHGQLICVSASPNITTTSGLLRLACTVGPYIAVLQVHADIIDDWSLHTAQRLTYLAKKFSFLIWEGGRILSTQRRPGESMSNGEITRSIDMARKRYTKGVVSVASWASLASTWVIGPEQQGHGADRLVSILRRAAKDHVSAMTMRVRTEISAGDAALEALTGDAGEANEHNTDGRWQGSLSVEDQCGMVRALRKASVISLTRTIMQHTEPTMLSSPGDEHDECSDDEDGFQADASSSVSTIPEPPLLSRGLVVCLPSEDDTRVSPCYNKAAMAVAKEHSDFVSGFSTDEPWLDVCRYQRFASWLNGDQRNGTTSSMVEIPRDIPPDGHNTFVVFSPLEDAHISKADHSILAASGEYVPSARNRPHCRQVASLHKLVARAVTIRDAHGSLHETGNGVPGQETLYIPVISVNA